MYLSPYITATADDFRNIISARAYARASDRGRILSELLETALPGNWLVREAPGNEEARWLIDEHWLFDSADDVWRASRLRYASIETVSACNQSCHFCPVSVSPRAVTRMSSELFAKIVADLGDIPTMEGVFLNNYNEPFLDRRLPQMARAIHAAGLKLAINTNASVPFDPAKWRAEVPLIDLLTVNLHTLDRERYRRERGQDGVAEAVRNIGLYAQHHLAETSRIVVLGIGDDTHDSDVHEIREHFAGTGIEIMPHLLMDRCGEVAGLPAAADPGEILGGCEQTGSRVLEHLHVLTDGRCVLCCEDYGENHIVGDLRTQSVAEVMQGSALASHRRKIYGFEKCDPNYICRACAYAKPGGEPRRYEL